MARYTIRSKRKNIFTIRFAYGPNRKLRVAQKVYNTAIKIENGQQTKNMHMSPKRWQERNADISSEITTIFYEHKGRYGVRRVYQELRQRGFHVNHKRVQRTMKQLRLAGKRPKEKYHSYKGEVGKIADNIINRDFGTEKPLEKWTTDVSQFNHPWQIKKRDILWIRKRVYLF